jgi:hypothetical protein
LVGAVYALLLVVLLYSEISTTVYRSAGERVIAFGVVQVVFMATLLSMHYSVWPATGTKM